MGRRQKTKRRPPSDDEDEESTPSSSDDDDNSTTNNNNHKRYKKVKLLNQGSSQPRRRNKRKVVEFGAGKPEEINDDLMTDADIESKGRVGFCCAVCTCNAEEVEELLPAGDDKDRVHRWFASGDGGVYHRRCCHGAFAMDTRDMHTEFENCQTQLYNEEDPPELEPVTSPDEWVTTTELEAAYITSRRQESKLYNEDGLEHPGSKLLTSDDYIHHVLNPFNSLKQAIQQGTSPRRKGLVVVDAFAGVGTALVAMKRLGLPITKVIHIEIDKVATHVAKVNHPDIEFVGEIPKFDKNLVDTAESFCDKYGPVDIIVGGPPCVDYCSFNANAQGIDGQQGQYLPQFLKFIRRVEHYQKKKTKNHPLFFVVENVILTGKNLEEVNGAFQFDWDPIMLDAGYFSPAQRRRHFWTNIPLSNDLVCDQNIAEPEVCLDNHMVFPAHIVHPELHIKAPCMMASAGRIDDRTTMRMYVFDEKKHKCPIEEGSKVMENRYLGRPMKVNERERLMGYPEGYVERPGLLCRLFRNCW
jgi:hypothetical protein